ncbi:MAG: hypothetical protein IJE62_07980 [Clostridia bacterium]|nr:hypothetical protein [Clostridia bacterium]
MEQFEDISFKRLAEMIWKHVSLIVAITMIMGVLSFLYSKIMVVPEYESSVTMYVKNEVGTSMDKTLGSDIQTAQMLVDTYIVILKSDTFLNEVNSRLIEQGIYSYDAERLRASIGAKSVDGTEIFEVIVRDTDPTLSHIIANTIADVSPSVIQNFIEASSVKVIDYALEGKRVSPNVPQNMALGLLIGLLLGCVIVVIREIFDMRIKTEDDLKIWFNLPILGVIPDISEAQNRRGAYAYRSARISYEIGNKEAIRYAEESDRNECISETKTKKKKK